MASGLENLGQDLGCSICRNAPEDLKILQCFHVFCDNCLATKVELNEDGRTFSCPSCKAEDNLPRCNDFTSLESSTLYSHIHRVLSVKKPATASSDILTCSCKKRNPPTSYCDNCARYLCAQCFDAHELLTEGHRILNLTEIEDQDYKRLFRQPSFCENRLHHKEILNFYCKTCECCICQQCLLRGHRGEEGLHDISDLESRAQIEITSLQEKLAKLAIKKVLEANNLALLEELVSKTRLQAEDAKAEVIKAAEELIKFVEESKRESIRQIHEELISVVASKEQQKCLLQQTRSAKDHVSKLTEYATACQVMNCKDSIQKRLENVFALKANLSSIDQHIEFIPSDEAYKLQEVGLGTVMKHKPANALTSAVRLESKLEALLAVKISVFMNSAEKPTSCPEENVKVSVEPKLNVKHLQVLKNHGWYSVNFIPLLPGEYTVEVKINGRQMSNSPLSLEVKPQRLEVTKRGLAAPIRSPGCIALSKSNDKIAIADEESGSIYILNFEGNVLSGISCFGKDTTHVESPASIALQDNSIVVADRKQHRIVILDSYTGEVLEYFGKEGKGVGKFVELRSVHVDARGSIIVCGYQRVQVFKRHKSLQFQIDKLLTEDDFYPSSAVTHGDMLIVSDWYNGVIYAFDLQEGSATKRCVLVRQGNNDGEVMSPRALAVDNDSNLLVCDEGNNRIQKFTLDGCFVGKTYQKIDSPQHMAVLADGRLLVTEVKEKRMLLID